MHKILLVEDNETNRDMLTRRLQRHGFSVCCAEDGAAGVAMAASANGICRGVRITDLRLLYPRDEPRGHASYFVFTAVIVSSSFAPPTNGERPAITGSGYGLTGMRERAELIGGELTAGPAGEGFRVWLTIPR